MGNEASRRAGARASSSDDPPYATATQPIGESPRRILKTHSLSAAPKPTSAFLQRNSPKSSSLRHSIVTVHEGNAEEDTLRNDAAMIALHNVPQFFPIIRETVRNPVMREINTPTKLDVLAAHSLVTKYQTVLRENAEDIARNQQQLSQRVQDMDYAIGTLHQILQEKSRKLAKQTEQLSSISQIKALLNSSKMCLRKSEETLNRINGCLPPEHRMEKLSIHLDSVPSGEGSRILPRD
ncbi:uncharacterized protein LOC100899746 [Galendromus occidentalis]|uniref:BLOC-1-related complex subunit 5 n=1 Tax=Galendromus occidentalis TaxID=34638 RepID=A0AAJ6VX60_9ACAR|nr:uncharacterized protein LOC100899746 [Galendromus occidentalis]